MDHQQDPYNKGGFLAFAFSVTFCLIFFFYIAFIHPGVDLKEVAVEAEAADSNKLAPQAKPWEESEPLVAQGQKVYKQNCAICHGDSGKGDGAAGVALKPPPRNLVEGKWTAGGTSKDLFTTLQNGLPGTTMAPFKHLPKNDRWAMVQYIRSITQNKEPDDAEQLAQFAETAE